MSLVLIIPTYPVIWYRLSNFFPVLSSFFPLFFLSSFCLNYETQELKWSMNFIVLIAKRGILVNIRLCTYTVTQRHTLYIHVQIHPHGISITCFPKNKKKKQKLLLMVLAKWLLVWNLIVCHFGLFGAPFFNLRSFLSSS